MCQPPHEKKACNKYKGRQVFFTGKHIAAFLKKFKDAKVKELNGLMHGIFEWMKK
jgi:hypothetical protein